MNTPLLSLLQDNRKAASSVTLEEMHDFLARHYKNDRFEGRNNTVWGIDYSFAVATSSLTSLREHGYGMISHHASKNGETVIFDGSLKQRDSYFFTQIIEAERHEILSERSLAASQS